MFLQKKNLKKQIVKISEDGMCVTGIYADCLQGLGDIHVTRASTVEFNDAIGRWVVEPKIGPYAGTCLRETFERRGDALAAEVAVLTEQHCMGLL